MNLSGYNKGKNGFVINGIGTQDSIGYSVSSAGDVNGDGFDDMIIGALGAHLYHERAGASYVVFGGATVGEDGPLSLSSLNGTNGFAMHGLMRIDNVGWSVSSAGDINNDGFDDVIVGAPGAGPLRQSYVVFGGADVGAGGTVKLAKLDGSDGFVINGIDFGDNSGVSVSLAGDVNGDGIDDLIIGAPFADPNGLSSGESYVVFGSAAVGAGGALDLSSLDGTNGFVINGIHEGDTSGRSVSSAGDVNRDGIDDVLIGANWASPNGDKSGQIYVLFGGPSGGTDGSFELSSLNGDNGFVINGIHEGDAAGSTISTAGDVNGDGLSDIIIGAHTGDPNGTNSGESYVILCRSCPLTDLNGDGVVGAADVSVLLGCWGASQPIPAACFASDVNGDGVVNAVDLSRILGSWGT
jgi:hypothetical protein